MESCALTTWPLLQTRIGVLKVRKWCFRWGRDAWGEVGYLAWDRISGHDTHHCICPGIASSALGSLRQRPENNRKHNVVNNRINNGIKQQNIRMEQKRRISITWEQAWVSGYIGLLTMLAIRTAFLYHICRKDTKQKEHNQTPGQPVWSIVTNT